MADPLKDVKKLVLEVVKHDYRTVEEFCWDRDLNKATISNLINDKKDFRISTLEKIAKALNKKLVIRLE